VIALSVSLALIALQSAHAQEFTVLHTFTGGGDGSSPYAGLTMDASGNFYGTTIYGGITSGSVCHPLGCGVVFRLARQGTGWVLTPIYQFTGGGDGAYPAARVMIAPDGTLYGTTAAGGTSQGGVVFRLQPPARTGGRVFSPWSETVVYGFPAYYGDGAQPYYGDLLFDHAGNIYGTTFTGGFECGDAAWCGTVYKLSNSGGVWTETMLYAFPTLGIASPQAGVIADTAGNLYSTTTDGQGAVFQLTTSAGGWSEQTLHEFFGGTDGSMSIGGLVRDPAGNLYGGTAEGGTNGAGVIYELTPSGGGWSEQVIYNFTGIAFGPVSALVRDTAGSLYGTTCEGGSHGFGSVFKLTQSGDQWNETDLHDFTGGDDGGCPWGGVVLDAQGNVYGTSLGGGTSPKGVIFQIAR
jgi:uncharacterized repeat protein (TIGR03803 family)